MSLVHIGPPLFLLPAPELLVEMASTLMPEQWPSSAWRASILQDWRDVEVCYQ
jgi:hypothetical protein